MSAAPTTVMDLVRSALRKGGLLAAGEALSASEAEDGRQALIAMLDAWGNETLMMPVQKVVTKRLCQGIASYTIGITPETDCATTCPQPPVVNPLLCQGVVPPNATVPPVIAVATLAWVPPCGLLPCGQVPYGRSLPCCAGLPIGTRPVCGWLPANCPDLPYVDPRIYPPLPQPQPVLPASCVGYPHIEHWRPQQILAAYIRDASGTDYPIKQVAVNHWTLNGDKAAGGQPSELFLRSGYPYHSIELDYAPLDCNSTLIMEVITELSEIVNTSSLADDVLLPAGYNAAIVYNLAVELAPEYGQSASAEVIARASEYKRNIKRSNSIKRSMAMRSDSALLMRRGFNIRSM